jgi:acetyltransferase-like isoleucine patch superfamily enzyme
MRGAPYLLHLMKIHTEFPLPHEGTSMIRHSLGIAVNTVRLHRDPVRYFRSRGARIGDDVEIFGANLFTFGSEPYLVTIGNKVTISHKVDFITHDGGMRVVRCRYPNAYLYGRIHVADHCFIGAHSILLPGARVGAGSVIGSGAIVTGDIPPGVVAVGAPAKPLKSVEEYIEEKRHLWIDTRGLTANAKRQRLCQLLPE